MRKFTCKVGRKAELLGHVLRRIWPGEIRVFQQQHPGRR